MKISKNLLGSLLATPATSKYPKGGLRLPAIARGSVTIDESTCTLCGLCARRCPSGAITTDRHKGELFIDRMKCIACGECVWECPAGCLEMSMEYLPPDDSVVIDVFNVKAVPGSDQVLFGIEMPAVAMDVDPYEVQKLQRQLREVQARRRRHDGNTARKKKNWARYRNKRQK